MPLVVVDFPLASFRHAALPPYDIITPLFADYSFSAAAADGATPLILILHANIATLLFFHAPCALYICCIRYAAASSAASICFAF